jgi:hypothetical protein
MVPKKINRDLAYNPAILIFCVYPREMKTYFHTNVYNVNVPKQHCS